MRPERAHDPYYIEVEGKHLLLCGFCGESEASHAFAFDELEDTYDDE